MALRTEVADLATATFRQYTPQYMKSFLSTTIQHLRKVSKDFLHICLFGGIGNGRDNKWRGLYLDHEYMEAHLGGFSEFEKYLAASDVFMVHVYRWNGIILQHLREKFKEIHTTNQRQKIEFNEILKETSYDDVVELFDDGT